jgi:tetratricopeptide (TPR) repeat protein
MRKGNERKRWPRAAKKAIAGENANNGSEIGRNRRGSLMSTVGKRIDDLIAAEKWREARALIEKSLKREPDSHWLLTQLAATHYEQGHYEKALKLLLQSKDIVPDCPLTLWHLAGTLDALGRHKVAIRIYTWLLESKKTAADDSCWESSEWSDALKTDCVYRIGVCFRHAGETANAAQCLQRYVSLVTAGMPGTYPVNDVIRELHELQPTSRDERDSELIKTAKVIHRQTGRTSGDVTRMDSTQLLKI